MYILYTRTRNSNIIILYGTSESFRHRQRDPKIKSFKFISFREMEKSSKAGTSIYAPCEYNTHSRL